ncbi:sulfite exporter TauE/SafE family protein [Paenibacillus ferrarius]|uniref:sulfite exporter TauE/SafE family protein n=1 Tax=Paenibacillus ferrarius TaxID=1469647 RepID=UPI003D2C3EB1
MDVMWVALLFTIGVLGSFISGLVGIGGSIILYPLLLFVPPLLGFGAFTAQEVSAISAVQVFFASMTAMLVFRKGGYLHRPLVLYMGVPIIAGSFIGSFFSNRLPDSAINLVYAVLALAAAILMFLPKKGKEAETGSTVTFNKPLAAGLALVIGSAAGIVGAAGAFLTVPVMLVLLRIPTRVAIASSLAITFVSSIGAVSGKLLGGHIQLVPAIVLIVASTLAAPIGAKLSKRVNIKVLQAILAVLIIATVIKVWLTILT